MPFQAGNKLGKKFEPKTNAYRIEGELCFLVVNCKGESLEAVIDSADIERITVDPGCWYAEWCEVSKRFYVKRQGTRKVMLHRLVMQCSDPKLDVDHINHDGLDNRKANLRCVSRSVNARNRRGPEVRNLHGFRGVSRSRNGKWEARYKLLGRSVHLGTFDTPEAAHAAFVGAMGELDPVLCHL